MGRITAGVGSTKKAEIMRMRYRAARMTLLIAVAFGALNTVFLFIDNAVFYSPFAFALPYGLMLESMFWTGQLYTPADYEMYFGMTSTDFLHRDTVYVYAVFAVIAIAVPVICWLLSKKHAWALIAGCVIMALDIVSVLFFLGISLQNLTELLMHVLMLVIMIWGVVAHYRLQFLAWAGEDVVSASCAKGLAEHADTPALHAVDYSAKGKIIMIYDVRGYTVCYRRVGRINELIVNKMVYDTVDSGRHDQPHELCAYVEGHEIMVGTGADATAYLRFDGEVVKKAAR